MYDRKVRFTHQDGKVRGEGKGGQGRAGEGRLLLCCGIPLPPAHGHKAGAGEWGRKGAWGVWWVGVQGGGDAGGGELGLG